jgi:hypothetical protein
VARPQEEPVRLSTPGGAGARFTTSRHEAKTREERLNRVHPAAQRHESRRPDIREPRRDGTGCALRETREIQRCGNRGEATLAVPWRDSQRLKNGTEPERTNPKTGGENHSKTGGAALQAEQIFARRTLSQRRAVRESEIRTARLRSSGVGTESCGGTRIKEKLRASAVGERRRRRVFRDKNKTRARSACLRRKTCALTSRDPQHGRHEAA